MVGYLAIVKLSSKLTLTLAATEVSPGEPLAVFAVTHGPRKDAVLPSGDSKLLNNSQSHTPQIKLLESSYPFKIISNSRKTFVSLANAS